MGFRSNAPAMWLAAGANRMMPRLEDWRLSPEAFAELQLVRLHRTNLLLLGVPSSTRTVLDLLALDPEEPVVTWHPGQPLDLPAPSRPTTLILHNVQRLTPAAQSALQRWLDQCDGAIRVVSTTPEPLWPRVEAGAFDEALYYRLNIVLIETVSVS